jgi:hypothetical protein
MIDGSRNRLRQAFHSLQGSGGEAMACLPVPELPRCGKDRGDGRFLSVVAC